VDSVSVTLGSGATPPGERVANALTQTDSADPVRRASALVRNVLAESTAYVEAMDPQLPLRLDEALAGRLRPADDADELFPPDGSEGTPFGLAGPASG
jgi:hypothetical protein